MLYLLQKNVEGDVVNIGTKQPYVFISYSSKNSAEAEAVRDLLNRNGLQNWMAPHDIPAGAKYAHIIDEAIENCACVLLLLTKEAQDSDHIDREMERAVSYKREIIPMRLDHCALNSGFRYYIGSCQIIDVAVFDEANAEMQTIIQRLHQINETESNAFLSFLEVVRHWQSAPKTYVIDPIRLRLLKDIYEGIITLLREEGYEDDDYKVTIEPDPLEMGDAYLSFVCADITICNAKAFCTIVQHFDDFEIYPLIDNKLRFSGTLKKVAHVSRLIKNE